MRDKSVDTPSQLQSQVVRTGSVPKLQRDVVHAALRLFGADEYDLLLPETRYIAQLLKTDEIILGAVFGKYTKSTLPVTGRGLFVITNYRLLLVDKKPLFLQFDEIKFEMVSGIQYSKAFRTISITLNTRVGNFTMRTFNDGCARQFVQSIEDMLFDKERWQRISTVGKDNVQKYIPSTY